MDHLSGRLPTLEQQVHTLTQHTHTATRQLRWWRGIACGMFVLGLVSWLWPSYQAPDASAAKMRHEGQDRRHHDDDGDDVEQRLQALEDKLAAITFDAATNEVVITGANLHIVNGLGSTSCTDEQGNPIPDCPNGLGNLIVGYNEPRNDPIFPHIRTGSHNVVVGQQHNFSRFRGLVVGDRNTISGDFAAVSGGHLNIASGDFASVSGGNGNTAGGAFAAVSGGALNMASGTQSVVSGGVVNIASGDTTVVSGGRDVVQDSENGWAAGSMGSEVLGSFRSP